ncbi:hypothetical protein JRO89_XS01G0398500 [Xanthoceras sorbifolium]|uniref:HMA domain-containing protein n=1 Tax=Xanthoceras sorbifolium TaxID=99658 RepID=A0ABQ8IQ61_9ROSI|nr:hypothetical protein JRO89_XS01G0398500 [Xanthoceras sorbifolium]
MIPSLRARNSPVSGEKEPDMALVAEATTPPDSFVNNHSNTNMISLSFHRNIRIQFQRTSRRRRLGLGSSTCEAAILSEEKKPAAEEKKPEEPKKAEEEKKGEEKPQEKPADEKKEAPAEAKETKEEPAPPPPPPPPQEIVLKVYMHCEGCARKVRRSLKGFPGVEDVITDCKTHKVVVKGEKADPLKVLERVQRKSRRQVVELLSPIPKPPSEEDKKPEEKEKPKPEEKKEEPQVITVVLKVHMHCEACAQEIKKRILRMKGLFIFFFFFVGAKPAATAEDTTEETKVVEVKKNEYYYSPGYAMEMYAYPPQIFSDENPNACNVM